MIGWVEWTVLGAVVVAALVVVNMQLLDWRKKRHAYRMKRLEYDEKAVDDAEREVKQ